MRKKPYWAAVFSAYAEVVPRYCDCEFAFGCILRVRGGSSEISLRDPEQAEYSPRTRR